MKCFFPNLASLLIAVSAITALVGAGFECEAQCIRAIKDPAKTVLDLRGKYRLQFNHDLTLPKSDDRYSQYENFAVVAGGKVIQPEHKMVGTMPMISAPIIPYDQPYCTMQFNAGALSLSQMIKMSDHCEALAKQGKFCDAESKYSAHIQKGEFVDFDSMGTGQEYSGCNGRTSVEAVAYVSQFKINLWNYKGYFSGNDENVVPQWNNGIYQIYCRIPNANDCSKSITVESLQDNFPPGSVTLFQIDDSVENCSQEAQ